MNVHGLGLIARLSQTAKAPVMMMISNCEPKSPRNQYLAELMRHIDIDSYGKCFHNKVSLLSSPSIVLMHIYRHTGHPCGNGWVAVVGGEVELDVSVQVHHRHREFNLIGLRYRKALSFFHSGHRSEYVSIFSSLPRYIAFIPGRQLAVYLGAPNVADFQPSEKSVIKVSDYEYVFSERPKQ
jgi:hypothetical protein